MGISKDDGVIAALIERFTTQRLPRLLKLKEQVERGEKLGDLDITFLEEVFADAGQNLSLGARHPEYKELESKILSLYHDITTQALKNEQAS